MMKGEEKNLLINQVQTDVSFISFLSVISVFFIGALLPKFNSYDLSVKIPISFLIVATVALLFSALILSNASSKIVKGEVAKINKYLNYGYSISEYMGVYLFVLSVPLAVSIITADPYLRIVTFCAAILGISIYQFMGFSLLQNHFSKKHTIFSVVFVLFGIALFVSQIFGFHFTIVSVIFLLFTLLVTSLAPLKSFQ